LNLGPCPRIESMSYRIRILDPIIRITCICIACLEEAFVHITMIHDCSFNLNCIIGYTERRLNCDIKKNGLVIINCDARAHTDVYILLFKK